MDWIKRKWGEIVVVGLAEAAVAATATVVFRTAIDPGLLRDLAIILIWPIAIISGVWYLRRPRETTFVGHQPPSPPTSDSPLFFRDRTEMNAATGGLLGEVKAARQVWYAGIAGEYARANGLYAMPQFQRALLLDPYGRTISRLVAAVPGETESHLRQTIEQATREAQAANVEVKWYDGPILGMTILEPNDPDGSVRAEVFIPFSLERPNFKIHRGDTLYSKLLDAFDKVWAIASRAVINSAPVLLTVDSQIEARNRADFNDLIKVVGEAQLRLRELKAKHGRYVEIKQSFINASIFDVVVLPVVSDKMGE